MSAREAFLWGSIGGLAPEVLRWFKIAATGGAIPQLHWLLYVVFLVLYVLIAGLVAIAFRPDNAWKGLWVGASLPALIAVLVQSAPKGPGPG